MSATMFSMPSQIDTYQEMSALSARMVEAAKSHNWELLVELEQSVAMLRDSLAADSGTASGADDPRLKAALIQRILDDDAEIRRHTEPWMEHVRQFLGGGHNKRRVDQAYGASQL